MGQRLQRARDEAAGRARRNRRAHRRATKRQLGELRSAIADAEPQLARLQADDQARQEALRDAEATLADWQQRWDAHVRAQSEAARAGDVERTRIDYLGPPGAGRRPSSRDAGRGARRPRPGRAGARPSPASQTQHDTQKQSLDALNAEVEARKQAAGRAAGPATRSAGGAGRSAQAGAGQPRPAVVARNAAARGARAGTERRDGTGCRRAAWIRPARVGEKLDVDAGWENAVEGVLGQLIEGVLVEAPEALVDALGELGEGRLTLVVAGRRRRRPTRRRRWRRRCRARRRSAALLSQLHARRDAGRCARDAAAPGRRRIGHHPRRRVARRRLGARAALGRGASRARLLRAARDPGAARARSKRCSSANRRSTKRCTALRDRLLDAEQQREDAQRASYPAHRGVSRTRRASCRASRAGWTRRATAIDAHRGRSRRSSVATLDASREQAREARSQLDEAVAQHGRPRRRAPALDDERRTLGEARDAARNAARESREPRMRWR